MRKGTFSRIYRTEIKATMKHNVVRQPMVCTPQEFFLPVLRDLAVPVADPSPVFELFGRPADISSIQSTLRDQYHHKALPVPLSKVSQSKRDEIRTSN